MQGLFLFKVLFFNPQERVTWRKRRPPVVLRKRHFFSNDEHKYGRRRRTGRITSFSPFSVGMFLTSDHLVALAHHASPNAF